MNDSTLERKRALAVRFIKRMQPCRGLDEELITADFRWWAASLGWIDRDQMRQLLTTLDAIMPEMPEMTILGTTAEGDRVAIEAIGRCALANGKRYDSTYHFLITVRGERVCAVKEYTDTKLAHETFGPVN